MNWETVMLNARKKREAGSLKVVKTEEEWKQVLPPEVFHITRKKGTERPFSNQMCSTFEPGVYECACCGTALFDANEKFESGTGWPSFTKPVNENAIICYEDLSFGQHRIEVCCQSCDAHLGHVFPDGPKPSRLRFCINALALKKVVVK
ncbi:MAG: peptide-methionine (R)-S-oxide reductase MsrB [Bacteroidota bacterium]